MYAIRTIVDKRRFQSGQALLIIALSMVALFGFTALALDGGMLYSERRRAQNAADTGALAAALAKINGENLHVIALQRIDSNGFGTTWGPCDPAGYDCTLGTAEKWTVEVSNPPRHGDYVGDIDYIQVIITTEVNSSFAHLVFKGPLRTTVEAVSRVRPRVNIAPGNALHANTEHDCKAIWVSGTGAATITGGYVFSNSDADTEFCQSGVLDGTGDLIVNDPYNVQVVGTFDEGGSATLYPATPDEGVPHQELYPVPTPDCPDYDGGNVHVNAGDNVTLDPGTYDRITVNDGTLTLNPGMYCIDGVHGFTGTGGEVYGDGVMIYMIDGDFDLSGNSLVQLYAEDEEGVLVDDSDNDWQGMLLYVDPGNSSAVVKLTGSSDSIYSGTVYAPNNFCTIEGNEANLGLDTQVICDTIRITGTADFSINYNQDNNYKLPPAIDLAR
jgi:hypothetical protein